MRLRKPELVNFIQKANLFICKTYRKEMGLMSSCNLAIAHQVEDSNAALKLSFFVNLISLINPF